MGTLNLEITLKNTGILVCQVDIFRNSEKKDGDGFSEVLSCFSTKKKKKVVIKHVVTFR